MSKQIALMTFGVMKGKAGDPAVQGFVDRIGVVYAESEGSAGFFARSIRNPQTWEHSWGPVLLPRCCPAGVTADSVATTLSRWHDLESVAAFAYHGLHGQAVGMRDEWFLRGNWPSYVAWWVPEGHELRWAEGCERIDLLHEKGASPDAFTFKQPFDANGKEAPRVLAIKPSPR
jgi:hypothetical protein